MINFVFRNHYMGHRKSTKDLTKVAFISLVYYGLFLRGVRQISVDYSTI